MSEVEQFNFSLTAPARLLHPNLLEAKSFMGPNGKANGEPKFSARFLLSADHPDLKAIKDMVVACARAKWPTRALSELAFPIESGIIAADKRKAKGKEDGEFMRSGVLLTARSKFQPRLAGIENGRIVEYETDVAKAAARSKFYFGVDALALFSFSSHEVGSNKPGVNAYLNMVLTTGKGERIAGGKSAAEVFKGYQGSYSAEDPTGGLDVEDDLPF